MATTYTPRARRAPPANPRRTCPNGARPPPIRPLNRLRRNPSTPLGFPLARRRYRKREEEEEKSGRGSARKTAAGSTPPPSPSEPLHRSCARSSTPPLPRVLHGLDSPASTRHHTVTFARKPDRIQLRGADRRPGPPGSLGGLRRTFSLVRRRFRAGVRPRR
ncbi:hypothetical protein C2845_PM16G20430 [Panicum miliaceum]|uniref:Uncharacterized protein n=1 Tax=Panicum miliaceum TaxID=4540 RepID=A0A3L6PU66_PANMI|nr:hypothetical protein C2845_PM16G20430 [Panicum miliaceum]